MRRTQQFYEIRKRRSTDFEHLNCEMLCRARPKSKPAVVASVSVGAKASFGNQTGPFKILDPLYQEIYVVRKRLTMDFEAPKL